MFIILKNNKAIGTSSYKPNEDDLATRNESFIVFDEPVELGSIYTGKEFLPPEIIIPDAVILTSEEKLQAIRMKRDTILNNTSYIFQRQITGSENQKLTEEEYNKWIVYWQQLRDFPETCDVNNPAFPIQPDI